MQPDHAPAEFRGLCKQLELSGQRYPQPRLGEVFLKARRVGRMIRDSGLSGLDYSTQEGAGGGTGNGADESVWYKECVFTPGGLVSA